MFSRLYSYPLAALLWLLHFLPLSVLAPIGRGVGRLIFACAARRRRIATLNIDWCFPELSQNERRVETPKNKLLALANAQTQGVLREVVVPFCNII